MTKVMTNYTTPDFSWVGGNTLFSPPGTWNIEENKVQRLYHDNYLNDGSVPNRSIAASVKPSRSLAHPYSGPMTVHRMLPKEAIENIKFAQGQPVSPGQEAILMSMFGSASYVEAFHNMDECMYPNAESAHSCHSGAIEVIEKEWTKGPWAMGAPSPVIMPGSMTSEAGEAIRSVFDKVHFIGTETSHVWKGYLDGAVRSGERGAAEVITALGLRPAKV
uniref:Amine oxidase n=1 Tax=Talaromyces marneffei PM1 TaxID=1077442 RepID=A0A093UYN6_TALMA